MALDQSAPVGGSLPRIEDFPETARELAADAMQFMGFAPGAAIKGTKVDVAFIGSCTNGRTSDFVAVAEFLRRGNYKVASGVKALAVPGSEAVRRELAALGIDKQLEAAGFQVRNPGCSMCLGMNPDKLVGEQTCASSSNRNFKGRQGSTTGRTLIMSPVMVAAAAVRGYVDDARTM